MEDDWDFYRCRVDDAPASIFLNLALANRPEEPAKDTLYAIRISMVDAGPHGMGTAEEAGVLNEAELSLVAALAPKGIQFVGCLRNREVWQVTMMGPAGLASTVERVAHEHLDGLPRAFTTVTKPDPEWGYYANFLFPDAERMRWIQDRRLVDLLEDEGDALTERRRVDHWVYFPDQDAQRAFASAAVAEGFQLVEPLVGAPELVVQLHRIDSVQLDDIHEVTGVLDALASRFGGDYDGWETQVQ